MSRNLSQVTKSTKDEVEDYSQAGKNMPSAITITTPKPRNNSITIKSSPGLH